MSDTNRVPPLVRHRLEQLEADTTDNADRLDGLRRELTQIKYALYALVGMGVGEMVGMGRLLELLFQ